MTEQIDDGVRGFRVIIILRNLFIEYYIHIVTRVKIYFINPMK